MQPPFDGTPRNAAGTIRLHRHTQPDYLFYGVLYVTERLARVFPAILMPQFGTGCVIGSLGKIGLAYTIVPIYCLVQENKAMPRADNTQLNIRSAYARNRVREIARGTGMTATEVIEDALRGYVPQAAPTPVEGLVRRGPVLVKPAQGQHVTQAQADQAPQAVRERDP